MKNYLKTAALIAFLTICIDSYADKPPIKLGNVSKQEIEMETYEADPDADAVVLCDYGYLTFSFNTTEGQWENHLKRICRIKIFNDNGYDWATESVLLYDDNNFEESVSQIKGFTYTLEDGKVVKSKLGKGDIFTEKTSKNYKRVKFTMPNAKEGSVIEFSYNVNSNYHTILDRWEFQKSIPVKWSEYIVSIPEYFTYLKNSTGFETYHTFETNSRPRNISWSQTTRANTSLHQSTPGSTTHQKIDYVDKVMRWIAKDMPALKDENFVGNYNNYMQGVDFQLSNFRNFSKENHPILSDWKGLVSKFINDYKNFGPNMKKKSFYKEVTNQIISEYQDPVERTTAVYNFVAQHMKWDGRERYIPSQSIKKSYDDRTGSCADINALLVSMLSAVEITADPVVISTIDNGLVHPVYPFINKYNYLIVRVTIDGKSVLLDATEKDLPFGVLPYRCLNQRGYAISKTRPGWVDLKPIKSMGKSTMCMLTLDEEGLMTGIVNQRNNGYSSVNIRKKITRDGKDKYIENLKSTNTDWEIGNVEIVVPEDINDPIKEKIELTISNAAEAMGNMIYINPILIGKIEENPLKQEKRKMPIEFVVPIKNDYRLNLTIPDGYVVDELPESVSMVTPDRTASLKYLVQVVGNNLQLVHSWQIKESFYTPDKFPDLKEFYSVLVSKQNEQIVLKKISSN